MHSQEKYTHIYVYKVHKYIHIFLYISSIDYTHIYVYNVITRSSKTATNKINQEVTVMCITKKELENKVSELKSLKTMKEELENELREVERYKTRWE